MFGTCFLFMFNISWDSHFAFFYFSLYKSEAMACEMFRINRCYLYFYLLAGVVYKAFGYRFFFSGGWEVVVLKSQPLVDDK